MAAVYPNAAKFFTTKKDLVEDVHAAHINDMQNEITAIEQTVGNIPQVDVLTPVGGRKDHGTVANRLQSITRGDYVPITRLNTANFDLVNNQEKYVGFSKQNDPFTYYNGSDITIKADGWYIFTSHAWVVSNLTGYRFLQMEQDGSILDRAMAPGNTAGSSREVRLTAVWQGLFHSGNRIRVKIFQNSGTKLKFHDIKLTMSYVRNYDQELF